MSRLAAMRALAEAIGWGDTLLYGIARLLSAASRRRCRVVKYHLMAQPVAAQPRLLNRRARYQIRAVDGADLVGVLPRPAQVLNARVAAGARCLAVYRGEDFAGCVWIMRGDYDEDEVRCRFRPLPPAQTAWDFDVYVAPEHRLGFAFVSLWDAVEADLRAAGVVWTMSRISAFNPASLGSHTRLGARSMGTATFLCLGRAQLMLSTLAPYLHVSWSERRVPLLRLVVNGTVEPVRA